MATITIDAEAYNKAKAYADSQTISVDEFVVSLIRKFVPKKEKRYRMRKIHELTPEVQALIGFAKPATEEDFNDLNGGKARMEYLEEKYK